MKGPAGIKPTLGFDIEAAKQGSYQIEVEPLASFFKLRFFNEFESVILIGNREQTRQIYDEIGRALDLSKDRRRRQRNANVKPKPGRRQIERK